MKLTQKVKTKYDFLYLPLIGNEVEIIDSKNSNYIGVKGKILFESAKFLILDVNSEEKKFKKDLITIKLNYDNNIYSIDCSLLENTLVNRLKKLK